mgnify:CR=1 FL=1
MRTMSKAWGAAGLRVGYSISSPEFRAAVDAVRQPFSVNALAQAAARLAEFGARARLLHEPGQCSHQ